MKTILLYIETSANEISKAILPVISAGLNAKNQFKAEKLVGVLLGGPGVAAAADGIKNFGLDEVVTLESPVLAEYNAIDFSQALLQVCKEVSPSYVMAAASSKGKDFIPRVSAQLDIPQASDVIGFLENAGYRRPIFAGNIIAEVELEGDVHAVTVRTSAFDQPQKVDADSPSRMISATIEKTDLMEVVSFNTVKSERPELGAASVVVSGGRALKSKENFESVLFPLADSLNAAVGASRAAVDSGYAPNDWQVGQTGKIVAPKLYIAVGISGAVQHLAGMKDSKVIVAINKDPEAPIFEVADYGLVADLFEALPEMVKLINA